MICWFIDCNANLGITNGDIPNENIRGSQTLIPYFAWNARINGASKWAADSSATTPWIQADVGYEIYISGVVTQGDAGVGIAGWVTSFKVSTFHSSIIDEEIFITNEDGTVLVRKCDTVIYF